MECGGAKDRGVIAAYTPTIAPSTYFYRRLLTYRAIYNRRLCLCPKYEVGLYSVPPATSTRWCPVSRMPATDSFAKTRPATSHIDLPPPAEDTFNDRSLVKLYVRPREVCDLNLSEKSCKKST